MQLRLLSLLVFDLIRPAHGQHLLYPTSVLLFWNLDVHIRQIRKWVNILHHRWDFDFLLLPLALPGVPRDLNLLRLHNWSAGHHMLLKRDVQILIDQLKLWVDMARVLVVRQELLKPGLNLPHFVVLLQ
jgi:hypothetical protein